MFYVIHESMFECHNETDGATYSLYIAVQPDGSCNILRCWCNRYTGECSKDEEKGVYIDWDYPCCLIDDFPVYGRDEDRLYMAIKKFASKQK